MEAGIKLFGKRITLPQLPSITIKQEGAGEGGRNAAAVSPEELSTTTTTTSSGGGSGGGGASSTNNTNNNYTYTDDHHHHHHHHHVVQNIKRPDKIVACPRCKSMDTKFCYFNNYNVNQPRHFCKSCQRYWTAGGALRNVPIGAGRRKAKPMPLLAQGPPTSTPTVFVDYSPCAVFDAAAASSSSSSYHDELVLEEYWAAAHQHRHQQPARGGLCDDFPVKRRREERAV